MVIIEYVLLYLVIVLLYSFCVSWLFVIICCRIAAIRFKDYETAEKNLPSLKGKKIKDNEIGIEYFTSRQRTPPSSGKLLKSPFTSRAPDIAQRGCSEQGFSPHVDKSPLKVSRVSFSNTFTELRSFLKICLGYVGVSSASGLHRSCIWTCDLCAMALQIS